jgi:adaptin ear-binding coat-associated protein 1/2
MESTDPATGKQLPSDAIQRILYIGMKVHVYNIPPLTSTKGYTAATWTEDPKRHIFTARLRVIETAIPTRNGEDKVKVDIVLEDASNGQLFAAAPYVKTDVIEPALDSSRFFAVRVQDDAGRKAIVGIGFEERPEAFDFSVALQEARKTLGLDSSGPSGSGGKPAVAAKEKTEEKRDYSLKEGETITVSFAGGKFGRRSRPQEEAKSSSGSESLSSFSLPPPPSASGSRSSSLLPPPPGPQSSRSQQPAGDTQKRSAAELGFDDGQFGEFA